MSITGKYVLETSNNFSEYLKAAGVGLIKRTLAEKVTATVEISEAYGRYTMKTMTALKDTQITFNIGQEFDETLADGRECKSIINKEGNNKLIHTQGIGRESSVTVREFFDTGMKATFTFGGVTATRTYKRVA